MRLLKPNHAFKSASRKASDLKIRNLKTRSLKSGILNINRLKKSSLASASGISAASKVPPRVNSRVDLNVIFAASLSISWGLLLSLLVFFLPILDSAPSLAAEAVPVVEPRIEKIVERPGELFTQGLLFRDGFLYESTGIYGQSAVYQWPHPGKTDRLSAPILKTELPEAFFGEGLAAADGSLFLLTWREGVVFKLDPDTLSIKDAIFVPGEGWGLAAAEDGLWISDGTSALVSRSPKDFSQEKKEPLSVRDHKGPVTELNELEFDQATGLILANIWRSNLVAAIDPADGKVRYYIDLGSIASKEKASSNRPDDAVANGLAIDEEGGLWITGKLWPRLYMISYAVPGSPGLPKASEGANSGSGDLNEGGIAPKAPQAP